MKRLTDVKMTTRFALKKMPKHGTGRAIFDLLESATGYTDTNGKRVVFEEKETFMLFEGYRKQRLVGMENKGGKPVFLKIEGKNANRILRAYIPQHAVEYKVLMIVDRTIDTGEKKPVAKPATYRSSYQYMSADRSVSCHVTLQTPNNEHLPDAIMQDLDVIIRLAAAYLPEASGTRIDVEVHHNRIFILGRARIAIHHNRHDTTVCVVDKTQGTLGEIPNGKLLSDAIRIQLQLDHVVLNAADEGKPYVVTIPTSEYEYSFIFENHSTFGVMEAILGGELYSDIKRYVARERIDVPVTVSIITNGEGNSYIQVKRAGRIEYFQYLPDRGNPFMSCLKPKGETILMFEIVPRPLKMTAREAIEEATMIRAQREETKPAKEWIPQLNQFVTVVGLTGTYIIEDYDDYTGMFILHMADSCRRQRKVQLDGLERETLTVPGSEMRPIVLKY